MKTISDVAASSGYLDRIVRPFILLWSAKWTVRDGYAEARVTKDVIGWHYSRRIIGGFNRWSIWQPNWMCTLLAALDFLKRAYRSNVVITDGGSKSQQTQ